MVKRVIPYNYPRYRFGVYRHYALLFWKRCASCKQEFRREKGWHYLRGPFYNGAGHRSYLCASCAPDRETAHALAISCVHIPPRPPAPPAAEPHARN